PDGVAPGLAYQRLAQATGGLRASLCQPASYRALSEALADWPINSAPISCVWLLPPSSHVVDALAVRDTSTLFRLSEARSSAACIGRHDAWLASGQAFALCGPTCATLVDAGYEFVEVSTRCERFRP
ncbi:MAG: hypothetical protein H6Q89_4142, partial [Myxococcaceae bacterium]|nr:hypothetical protein [Myxococcaceae bacterium]